MKPLTNVDLGGDGFTVPTAWTVPAVERRTTDANLEVFACHQPGGAVATARLVIHGGAVVEPPELAGITRLTAELLPRGTETRNVLQLAAVLEYLGASVAAAGTWDAIEVAVTAPCDTFPPSAGLLAEIVRRASFRETEVERARDYELNAVRQEAAEAHVLARLALAAQIFPAWEPHARRLGGTAATIGSLDAAMIAGDYRGLLATAPASLAIVGDLRVLHIDQIADVFGPWASAADPFAMALPFLDDPSSPSGLQHPQPVPAAPPTRSQVLVIDRPGATQAMVCVGHQGPAGEIAAGDAAVGALEFALCGGAESRLWRSLREEHGLTYGLWGGFEGHRGAGTFRVQGSVPLEATGEAVGYLIDELASVVESGFTPEEFAAARNAQVGSFPLCFQDVGAIGRALTSLALYDLPADHLNAKQAALGALTLDELNEAARRYLMPDAAVIVVVGDGEVLSKALDSGSFGPVTVHEAPFAFLEGEALR